MTTQIAKRARRPAICGTISVAAPFIAAFLYCFLIGASPTGFFLGILLIPLSLIGGVGFAVTAMVRREGFWLLSSLGLLINLAFVLWLVLWVTSPAWPLAGGPFEVFYRHSNPVADWNGVYQTPNPAIDKDSRDFITGLSLRPSDVTGQQRYLEDGTGQHAVTIEVARDGTYWTYVLIYDQNNKRIKVIKFISGHYSC